MQRGLRGLMRRHDPFQDFVDRLAYHVVVAVHKSDRRVWSGVKPLDEIGVEHKFLATEARQSDHCFTQALIFSCRRAHGQP